MNPLPRFSFGQVPNISLRHQAALDQIASDTLLIAASSNDQARSCARTRVIQNAALVLSSPTIPLSLRASLSRCLSLYQASPLPAPSFFSLSRPRFH